MRCTVTPPSSGERSRPTVISTTSSDTAQIPWIAAAEWCEAADGRPTARHAASSFCFRDEGALVNRYTPS